MEKQRRMPVLFTGHGSPMIALEHNEITETLRRTGEKVIREFGRPDAILMVSAHWYTHGSFVQSTPEPKQIYDMYGFPKALYEVKYPVKGSPALTQEVLEALDPDVSVNDSWGLDHGAWTVLVHLFPHGGIPVVQLSVNGDLTAAETFALGEKLAALRDRNFLIIGSGNVVHNLREVDWDNPDGSPAAKRFDAYISQAVRACDTAKVIAYQEHPDAAYAVPTPDHFLPLLTCLGAAGADREHPSVFNEVLNLGSIAMTGFAWGMEAAER